MRSEQLSLETATTAHRRLQELHDSLTSDIVRGKMGREQDGLLHDQQISALTSLVTDQEENNLKEKAKLREELSKQFNANSALQQESFLLLKAVDVERRRGDLKLAAAVIFDRLKKLRLSRMSHMFRMWSTTSTLIGAAEQFRHTVNELVRTTLANSKREKESALAAADTGYQVNDLHI